MQESASKRNQSEDSDLRGFTTVARIDTRAHWDAICQDSPAATFFHSTAYQNFAHLIPRAAVRHDCGFVLYRDGAAVAICPLTVEAPSADAVPQGMLNGEPLMCPALSTGLGDRDSDRVRQAALAMMESKATAKGAKRLLLTLTPTSTWARQHRGLRNPLWKSGYSEVPRYQTVVDLQKRDEELLRAMTKGHRAAVTAGQKVCDVDVHGADITDATFAAYEALHILANGGRPRPEETYRMMLDWVRGGSAFLYGCRPRESRSYVAFALVIVDRDVADYGSACKDPNTNLPVGQVMQWAVFQDVRKRGVRYYNLGPVTDTRDAKKANIAKFKEGFGGDVVSELVGEKFLDHAYARQTLIERAEGAL